MNDEIFDLYLQSGRIAQKILADAAAMVRPGMSVLEFVEVVEAEVVGTGAGLAFPLNVSCNDDAAHDTASPGDERVFHEGDLVKVDLGVHVEGYIADTAVTVDLGDHPHLVEASRVALDRAIGMIRPGIVAGEVGAAIQQEIEGRGFRPVANLTGHGLDLYDLHRSPNIPNIAIQGGPVLEEGMAIAIEPFASTGVGFVSERPRTEIFQQITLKPVRMAQAKRLLSAVRHCRGLPFSRRMVYAAGTDLAISNLRRAGILHAYPVLHDIPGSLVSQAEHTIIVTADGCTVTTK